MLLYYHKRYFYNSSTLAARQSNGAEQRVLPRQLPVLVSFQRTLRNEFATSGAQFALAGTSCQPDGVDRKNFAAQGDAGAAVDAVVRAVLWRESALGYALRRRLSGMNGRLYMNQPLYREDRRDTCHVSNLVSRARLLFPAQSIALRCCFYY